MEQPQEKSAVIILLNTKQLFVCAFDDNDTGR